MATPSDVRKENTLSILSTLAEEGLSTKSYLAEKTGLTLMTVNTIINALMKGKGIVKDGRAVSDTGRKASLYRFNDSLLGMAGVNIGVGKITIVLSDMGLNVKKRVQLDFDITASPIKVCSLIHDSLLSFNKNLYSMGITVPGPVDNEKGLVITFPNIKGWEGFNLENHMEDLTGISTAVEKDNHSSVLYLYKKSGYNSDNLVALTIMGGIGMGLIINGRLYTGHGGTAGEIGHITVCREGPLCNCTNRGCLELYSSDYAIINHVKAAGGGKLSLDQILNGAGEGDGLCAKALDRASEYLAFAISNAIKHYDPSCFIINSHWVGNYPPAREIIAATVEKNRSFPRGGQVPLIFLDEKDIYIQGALMLARDGLIEDISDGTAFV